MPREPEPSELRGPRARTTWPVASLSALALVMLLLLTVFTQALDGAAMNTARTSAQVLIIGVVLARLQLARVRAERNRLWIFYLVGLLLAVPLWFVAENFVRQWSR